MTVELRDGKITANRKVLSRVATAYAEAAVRYEQFGLFTLASVSREEAGRIDEALEKSGYYKERK